MNVSSGQKVKVFMNVIETLKHHYKMCSMDEYRIELQRRNLASVNPVK